eukprot:COSAG02_NODE_2677_length_8267_cov_29.491797_1_plen_512_part_00
MLRWRQHRRELTLALALCWLIVATSHTPGDLPCCPVVGGHSDRVDLGPTAEAAAPCDPPPTCGCKHPDVVVASCWGFDPSDATASLQAAIDSLARTVVVPAMAERPWVLRANFTKRGAIQLRSNQQVILESGVELLAYRGAFRGLGDTMIQANNTENASLIGYGARLRMWRDDYASPPYAKGEWRSGLALRGVKNFVLAGLEIVDSGGDGIYLDSSAGLQKGEFWPPLRYNCESVVIRDVKCLRNYRQGMSVIGAINLTVTGSVFADTAGTPPAAGVDLEPDTVEQQLQGISFDNCSFVNNSGVGVDIFLLAFQGNSTAAAATTAIVDGGGGSGWAISVSFERCRIAGGVGSTHGGFRLAGVLPTGPVGTVRVTDSTIEDTFDSGILIEAKQYDRVAARFERCKLQRVATGRAGLPGWDPEMAMMAPIWIEKLHKFNEYRGMTLGGVELESITVVDDRPRPFLRAGVNETTDRGVEDISGSVTLHSPYANSCKADFGARSVKTAVRCVLAA